MSRKWCFDVQDSSITVCHVEGKVFKEHKRGNGVPFGRLLAIVLPDQDNFNRFVAMQNASAKIEQYVQVKCHTFNRIKKTV